MKAYVKSSINTIQCKRKFVFLFHYLCQLSQTLLVLTPKGKYMHLDEGKVNSDKYLIRTNGY